MKALARFASVGPGSGNVAREPSRIMKLARLIALQSLLVVATLAGAELLLRLIPQPLLMDPDEKLTFFRYDPELGWFPKANASGNFSGEIEYSVHQNSLVPRFQGSTPITRHCRFCRSRNG
ncbi:MAG: hypothetical protein JOY71_01085 [Acetobacteraceae bacterium]|nr:hypothetical protein [Acetobacteraceae bacterium]